MSERFYFFGLAGLQIIPIFTLTYLQHELPIISKNFQKIQSRLLSIIAMLISFGLILSYTLIKEEIIRIISSILLIITLSIGIHYTYDIYTLDEGYYITIPYIGIYSCLIFLISSNEYPAYIFESYRFSVLLLCTLICYLLFSISVYFDLGFSTSYLNYIALIGVFLTTFNLIFLINEIQRMKLVIGHLVFQFIHLYLYLAHLLSIQFEFQSSSTCQISHLFQKNQSFL